jgi:RNA polymerase sigma-70 factor (ECF subfamily)
MFEREFAFVWRMLRRLGVAEASIDDCAQHVFLVATRKIDAIAPDRERAFLLGVAINVAAEARRSQAIGREQPHEDLDEREHGAPDPEQLTDRKRALELLDRALEELSFELRTVFVLFEVEGASTDDIASLLDLPRGTVASRLRRAREEFHAIAKRLRARRR